MDQQARYYFGALDYMVFAAMLLISAGIGVYFAFSGGRQRTAEEVLLGNRKMNFIPVACSVAVSHISAIAVMGSPAEIYFYGMTYAVRLIMSIYSLIFTCFLFFPVFFHLKITSLYEVRL